MPLYDWECPDCGIVFEAVGTPEEDVLFCLECQGSAKKIFTKLTTSYKDKDRPWGRSLYRSHDKGEIVKKPKQPYWVPKEVS